LCALDNCKRKGTRLVTSLRYEYRLKPHGSNRVCEGHYRKDLRRFKKEHGDKAQLVNHRKDKKSPQPSSRKRSKSPSPSATPVGTSSSQRFAPVLAPTEFDAQVDYVPNTRKRKRSTSPQQIITDEKVMTDERMHAIEKYAFRILVKMRRDDPLCLGTVYNSQSDDEIDRVAREKSPASSWATHQDSFLTPDTKRRRISAH